MTNITSGIVVMFSLIVCAVPLLGMPERMVENSLARPSMSRRGDLHMVNKPVTVSISAIQRIVEQLESELGMKLMEALALNPEKRKDKCCWELVFSDVQGCTLWLHLHENGSVIGDKSKREQRFGDVKKRVQAEYASRLPVPWKTLNEKEAQKERHIWRLAWDDVKKQWDVGSISEFIPEILEDLLEGVDQAIYIEGNDIYDKVRYRKEITGDQLKQLREFLLSCHDRTLLVGKPWKKERIISMGGPFLPYDGNYMRLLIPGKKGDEVFIYIEKEEEVEKFFMTVGREDRAKYMRERFLKRRRGKRDKSR